MRKYYMVEVIVVDKQTGKEYVEEVIEHASSKESARVKAYEYLMADEGLELHGVHAVKFIGGKL